MTVQEMNKREPQSGSGFLSFITEKLRNQMLLAFLLSSLLPLLIFGLLALNRVSTAFRADSFQALDAVRVNKASQIENYFDRAAEETRTFALSPLMVDVMQDFSAGVDAAESEFSELVSDVDEHRDELSEFYEAEFPVTFESASSELLGQVSIEALILQHQYILVANEALNSGDTHDDVESVIIVEHEEDDDHAAEEHEIGAHQTGEFFLSDGSSSTYDEAHIAYHSYFIEALHGLGFNDMKLVSLDGDIIYTHLKSFDFMTSLVDGPYAETNLGRAYRSALAADSAEFTTIVDFEPYQPSLDAPAGFIAAPIFDGATKIGVLIFELPLNAIAEITNEHEGLGESGETYLIGKDNLWRNDSRFLDQLDTDSTILNSNFVVDTIAVQSAQDGQFGTQVIDDYRGVPVLSSWQPLVVQDGNEPGREAVIWSLMAEMDEAEVQGATNNLALIGSALIGLISVLLIGFAVVFSRFLTRQVDLMVDVFDTVQDGNLNERVNVISDDEVGQLAYGLNGLLDQLQGTLSETQSERDELQTSIAKLLDEVSDVAEGDLTIEADVSSESTGAIADSINYMLEQLREVILRVKDTTLEVSSSATQIQTTAEHLAQGSEQQAAQIIETSTAIDEMSVSIQKVSENTQLSSQVGVQARDSAQKGTKAVEDTIEGMIRIRQNVSETSKRIKSLGETSQEIGEIVDLIRNITNRTAILALNASIQAARAGEAGRSFVVVAEEIERLSERSGEATRQIADLVKAIQSETGLAVNSMEATTNEVVIGSKLANEAGIALMEIDQVSDRLAELTQSTAQAAQQQATSSEAIAHSMNDIAGVTQETASGTKQASQSILSLAELADELRQSVSEFKLDDQERAPETEGGMNERTYVSDVNGLTSLN